MLLKFAIFLKCWLTVSLLCDVHCTSHNILMCVLTCIIRHNVLLYFGILAQQQETQITCEIKQERFSIDFCLFP